MAVSRNRTVGTNKNQTVSTVSLKEMVFQELKELSEMYVGDKKKLADLTKEIKLGDRRIELLKNMLAVEGYEVDVEQLAKKVTMAS